LHVRRDGRSELMGLSYTGSLTYGSWVVCRGHGLGRRVVQVSEGYPTPTFHRVVITEEIYRVRGGFFHRLKKRTYSLHSSAVGSSARVAGSHC
jgi:hypothetical protein